MLVQRGPLREQQPPPLASPTRGDAPVAKNPNHRAQFQPNSMCFPGGLTPVEVQSATDEQLYQDAEDRVADGRRDRTSHAYVLGQLNDDGSGTGTGLVIALDDEHAAQLAIRRGAVLLKDPWARRYLHRVAADQLGDYDPTADFDATIAGQRRVAISEEIYDYVSRRLAVQLPPGQPVAAAVFDAADGPDGYSFSGVSTTVYFTDGTRIRYAISPGRTPAERRYDVDLDALFAAFVPGPVQPTGAIAIDLITGVVDVEPVHGRRLHSRYRATATDDHRRPDEAGC
ncbi:hypothetical protein [Cryptosporangium phraense]|uniref:Uncharacterized protein n=1 Tax=Cryptosporangium phraense TaxID=2593070 RepID=A0A545AN94_9ACTN|nr:hypothetical protein [Cryptosporangium phraense]TQS42743.1 hypothetical protein FL583_22015 [Cryptosporangium phraense]